MSVSNIRNAHVWRAHAIAYVLWKPPICCARLKPAGLQFICTIEGEALHEANYTQQTTGTAVDVELKPPGELVHLRPL